jgi:hypothetical protein
MMALIGMTARADSFTFSINTLHSSTNFRVVC